MHQVIVIVIEVYALEHCFIDGTDEIVKPVIFFREILQKTTIILKINRGQFKKPWLFLGAESACPMKRKSPVRRQEIMHVLSC